MTEKIPREKFLKSLKVRPSVTIEVVVKNDEGVILSKRKIPPFKGWWHIPGGFLMMYEELENAVHRVAKEETGFDVKIKKFLGIYDYQKGDPRGHIISLWYLTEPVEGRLKTDFQSEDIQFFKSAPEKTLSFQKDILVENGLLGG